MQFQEFDEQAAKEYFDMLKDAPTIRELLDTHPGLENLMHVMTAQLATHFILPYIQNKMEAENVIEAIRRYLITAVAFGIIINRNEQATEYILDLYNRSSENGKHSAG